MMNQRPVLLVIDDDPDQLEILRRHAAAVFSDREWQLESASTEEEGRTLIASFGDHIKLAVIDLYLRSGESAPGGLRLIRELRDVAPECFTVLVSVQAKSRTELTGLLTRRDRRDISRFVSLRFIDSDPITEYRNALFEGRRRIEHSL